MKQDKGQFKSKIQARSYDELVALVEKYASNGNDLVNKQEVMTSFALFYASQGVYIFRVHVPLFDENGVCIACSCEEFRHSQKCKDEFPRLYLDKDARCDNLGKDPMFSGINESTIDEDEIRKMFKPMRVKNIVTGKYVTIVPNIGIDTGKSMRLVLDADKYKEVYRSSLNDDFLPEELDTELVDTGGGGEHYYFDSQGKPYKSSTGTSQNSLPAGFDIRGVNNYTVAPPSLHKSGNRYMYRDGQAPGQITPKPIPHKIDEILAEVYTASKSTKATTGDNKPNSTKVKTSQKLADGILEANSIENSGWEDYLFPNETTKGKRTKLKYCPFNDENDPHAGEFESYIGIGQDGSLRAGCPHNRCQKQIEAFGSGWQLFRKILAPKAAPPPIITPTGIGTPLQSAMPSEVLAEPIGLDQLLEAIEAIRQALDLTPEQRRSKIVRELAESIGSIDKAERIEVAGALLTANAGFTKTKADEFVKDCASDVKKAHKNKIKQDNDTLIENLNTSGRYSVVDGRIGEWRTKRGQDGEIIDYFAPLCNFNAWIVADVAADDGEEVSRKIAIAGVLENGKPLPEIEIPADEFEVMKWPVALWGARVSIEPMKGAAGQLRHAIQLLSDNRMADRRTSTHTGWTVINGKRAFLHAGGALGSDDANVDLPRNLGNYRFPDDNAIDPVEAMRESIKLLDIAPARVSAPLWAAMYLGPLSEFIPPVFTLSVEGGSGSLKSSYSAVMLNHFGKKFTEYAMPADWLATANSLEKLSFHSKDVPLIIDDLRPSTNSIEARALQDAVSRITRAAGNRQGRSRLDSNSEFKRSYAPRGVVIMTAERKALGKSTNSRILTIDVEPGDIDPVKLSIAQKQRHIYAYAMAGFIQSVAKDWEELSIALPAQVADLRAANAGNGHHLRLPNATAILHTAFVAAMSYAIEIGAITPDEADRREQECYTALQNMAESQNQSTEAEDPARKYMTIIASLIAQDKAYLLGKGKPNIGRSLTEKLGWHDEEIVYLMPGAYNTVCKYATAEGWNFPSDETTLRKELERSGYIAKSNDDRLTLVQRDPTAPKTQVRVTAISYSKLREMLTNMGYLEPEKAATGSAEGDNDENA